MNGSAGAQRSHVSGQPASLSTIPCGGSKGATARAQFASPRLLHSSSMLTGSVFARSPVPVAEPEAAFSMSPTSVLDAAAFAPGSSDGIGKRRPWRDVGLHGLADALDCTDQQQDRGSVLAATSRAVSARAAPPPPALVRSCSLDRRVEFGVKNKSSWLPLRGGRETAAAAAPDALAETGEVEMEPSSEDYTCVISRGPNPRTVHIFGDRVVESSPRPINLPAPGDRGFLSLRSDACVRSPSLHR